MFAKLYGTDADQVLVKLDAGENGNPEVRTYFKPDGLGVCSIAAEREDDSGASWDKAEKMFAEARAIAKKVVDLMERRE